MSIHTQLLWDFSDACYANDLAKVIECVYKGVSAWGTGLYISCEKIHVKLINYFIAKTDDVDHLNCGLRGACFGGHMEMVELMVELGACDWHGGLFAASEKGHLEIVEYMIRLGATDTTRINQSLDHACMHGRREVADFLANNGATDIGVYSIYIDGASIDVIVDVIVKKLTKRYNIGPPPPPSPPSPPSPPLPVVYRARV